MAPVQVAEPGAAPDALRLLDVCRLRATLDWRQGDWHRAATLADPPGVRR
ncbi:hypothetical protein [Rhabdochromatium marinum]|nr:hypothetical protein [Rhabdochromatium marinum]